MDEILRLREKIVNYAAGGYRRRDIADLVGITPSALRRHLVALGIIGTENVMIEKERAKLSKRERARRNRDLGIGRSLAHMGPAVYVEADYE